MAMFPALRELFGTAPPQAPLSAAQAAVAGNIAPTTATGSTGSNSADSNATVPNSTTPASTGSVAAIPPAGKGEASPLENYKDLWKTEIPVMDASVLASTITADPAKMMEAAQKYDFTKGMSPELVTKATSGDGAALVQLINSAAQAGFAAAATASVTITKHALAEQGKNFETKYAPNMLRNAEISNKVNSNFDMINDPAAGPIVGALTKQLSAAFPTATADEVSAHVGKYLDEFAAKVVTSSGGKIQSKAELTGPNGNPLLRKEEDWENFFNMGS